MRKGVTSGLLRFYSKIKITPDCWEWGAYLDKDGYGKIYGFSTRFAHRISYLINIGDLDSNLVIDHICNNRKCVRPDHLQQITVRENVLRGTNFSAINARKTHCIGGHLLDSQTFMDNRKARHCELCVRLRRTGTIEPRQLSSTYLGVTQHKQSGKWQVYKNGKYLGLFKSEVEAARVYEITI